MPALQLNLPGYQELNLGLALAGPGLVYPLARFNLIALGATLAGCFLGWPRGTNNRIFPR